MLFCLPADQKVGPGDRFIAGELAQLPVPVVAVVTKADVVGRGRLAEHLLAVSQLGDWADIVPVSAVDGYQVDVLVDVHAIMFVERDSQKAIVIGKGGERLTDVGTRARKQIEALLGSRVYLDLHVKVAKDWQRDPRQLRRLGF